ncbi:hypothetical protein B0H14DRAFT_2585327 [Mycena olivaceomarginata]|nr:hypothetical protein B0H14DRAFT_2585327 [Mycena olivaceomarginata]
MQPPERYEKLDQETRDRPELRPGDHDNVLLRLHSLDPHRDSPWEDKYVWHEPAKVWNDELGALFAARLQSASLDGLNLPSLRSKYMVQYKKSLIGKHTRPSNSLEVFELWKANVVLGALLWFPKIKDMDQYLASAF